MNRSGYLLTSALIAISAAAVSAAPRIVCEQPVFDFGEKDETETVLHTFVLRNEGDADLNITAIRVSCGCTVADVSSRTVPPGGETTLDARLKLQGKRGNQNMTISIASDAPDSPHFVLTMRGSVQVDLGLEPSYLNFGQLLLDRRQPRDVKLISRDPTLEIVSVTGDHPSFLAESVRDVSGLARVLRITAQPPFEKGFLRAEFNVLTSHPSRPALRLSVSAMVAEPLYVIPKEIVLRGRHPAGLTRSLLVRPGQTDKIVIRGVKVPDERIVVKVEDIGNGNHRIMFTGMPVEAALDGKVIEIETDVPGYELLTVPIRVMEVAR